MESSSSSPEIVPSSETSEAQPRFSYKDATHEEVLEDLSSRFILNLPDEELASLERICFQVEQAHWFYEDFIREQNPNFPSLPLKKFSAMLFHACPLLHQWSHDHETAFNLFMQYKTRVPVCGAIMLNSTWDKCVLVKGWKSSSGWGFPKGKINEYEPQHVCAIREVLEETGYNLTGKVNPEDAIELSIKEQKISLFVVPGIEEDFPFQTKTRKEISRIEWFRLVDLPTWKRNKQVPGKFYLISPFIGPLKAFINERKPRASRKAGRQKKGTQKRSVQAAIYASDVTGTDADNDAIQDSDSQSPINKDGISETLDTSLTTPAKADHLLKADNLDPHFARLMNSLTLSASINPTKLVKDTKFPPADPTTPIPSSLNHMLDRELLPEAHSQMYSIAKSPSQSIPLKASLAELHRDSSTTPVATSHQPHSLRSPQSAVNLTQEALRSPTQAQPSSSSAAPASSPTMRRSTAASDVTPYLARASEVPSSARRLQQLALLEAVADESARMLPQTRANSERQPPFSLPVHPGSTLSSLPPPIAPSDAVPAYYPNQPLNMLAGPAYTPGYGVPLNNSRHRDLQERARSGPTPFARSVGQTFGSLSMGQNQLLALMNNAQPAPAPAPPPLHQDNFTLQPRQPQSYSIHSPPLSFSVPAHGTATVQAYPMARSTGSNLTSHNMALHAPGRYASATPAIDSFPVRPAPTGTAQTLLSILNGNRPLQGNSTAAPASINRPI